MGMHDNSHDHVRRMHGDPCEALFAAMNNAESHVDGLIFCSNPAEYNWKCLSNKEMFVPYNGDIHSADRSPDTTLLQLSELGLIRWQKHRVWVVEGVLQPGESNVLARRLFYIDEETWDILLGEGFDAHGTIVKCYMLNSTALLATDRQSRWYST